MNLVCVRIESLSTKINDHELSKIILETTPKIMRFIRAEMRDQAKGELTVPQFRVLLKLVREPDCTQHEVAEWMGIAAPTLTRMIDTLVKRKLVKRAKDAKDLRRTLLSATPAGEKMHQIFRSEVQDKLLIKMESLTQDEKVKITDGFLILGQLLK